MHKNIYVHPRLEKNESMGVWDLYSLYWFSAYKISINKFFVILGLYDGSDVCMILLIFEC